MTLNKQSLIAALEALKQSTSNIEDDHSVNRTVKAALSLAQQLDENVGVDAGIKSDFSAIWEAVEKVESKLHDKYHFHLPAVKKALADAHRMFRPLWDKLNSPQNLTFLDDENVVDDCRKWVSEVKEIAFADRTVGLVFEYLRDRLAQSKTTVVSHEQSTNNFVSQKEKDSSNND